MRLLVGAVWAAACFAQSAFEVAAVKPSVQPVGPDYRQPIVFGPDRVTARNRTLKDLIAAAWQVERYQVSGGPRFLDADEFDLDARAGRPSSRDQLATMLRTLLAERFHLAVHRESKDARVYVLAVAEGGPKIQPVTGDAAGAPHRFHGDMHRLAELLSVQLAIPTSSDPTKPGIATAPVPVVDQTGLAGAYDFAAEIRPEPGADMLLLWQRILHDQAGLKLEGRKGKVDWVVVDRVDRIPVQ